MGDIMFNIEGKYNIAKCYATNIEQSAIDQIRTMCDQPFADGSNIAIMPDAHAGMGCTIGTTMTITDKIVPNLVGVDIGCGIFVANLGKNDIDLPKLDEVCHYIPSGHGVWDGRKEKFNLTDLRSYRNLKDTKRLGRSLGTLGGGNHFIEVDKDDDGNNYLVIHSGSRNLGTQVATYYQKLAIDLAHGKGTLIEAKKNLIAEYKEQGRKSDIQEAIKQLNREFQSSPSNIPAELCYLYGEYMDDYLHDVKICQAFAKRNREVMAEVIFEKMSLQPIEDTWHTIHNYIDVDEMILRKGSISANSGERVIIPLNMRDGSIIAYGKGIEEWNYSAPHGAGRLMSRKKAFHELSMDEFKKSMEGIYTTSVCEDTLDEAPMAYKSKEDIIGPISESVDIEKIIKPIYNFKAS